MSPREYEERYNAIFDLIKKEFEQFRRLSDDTIVVSENDHQLVFTFCDDAFLLGHGITSGCVLYDKQNPQWCRVVLFPVANRLLTTKDITQFTAGFITDWRKKVSGAR